MNDQDKNVKTYYERALVIMSELNLMTQSDEYAIEIAKMIQLEDIRADYKNENI